MDKVNLLSSLSFGHLQPFTCEVHPAVPLQILQMQEAGKEQDTRRLAALLIGTSMEGLVEVKSCIPFYFQAHETKIVFKFSSLNELVELIKEAQPKYSVVGLYVSGDMGAPWVNLWGRIKNQHKTAQALLSISVGENGVQIKCFRATPMQLYHLALVQEVPVTLQVKQLDHIKPVQRLSQAVQTLREQVRQCREYLSSHSDKLDPNAMKLLMRCAKMMPKDEGAKAAAREESDIEMVKYLSEFVKVQLHISDNANNLL